jgi:hypothetical protein
MRHDRRRGCLRPDGDPSPWFILNWIERTPRTAVNIRVCETSFSLVQLCCSYLSACFERATIHLIFYDTFL